MYEYYTKTVVQPPGRIAKILLIMKLTTLLMITAILQVSASAIAQKVTISAKNAPLEMIFKQIRKQSGYDFAFTKATLNNAKPVNIHVKNIEVTEVLKVIFENQPLEYQVNDKLVVVSKKEVSVLANLIARFQAIDVKGRVVDEKGLPLVGASVSVKGGKGTLTDKDGNFFLAKVDEKAVLVISFIGYLTKELNGTSDLSSVVLELSNSKLDEVQIIAYGTTSQRFTTSNIASIKAVDIAKAPVTNVLLAIQGRVPGLYIEQSSGVSGNGIKVIVQGINSIGNGNIPFYVIDGVPYSQNVIPTNVRGITSGIGSAMGFINPSDIESIEVLKDADATAIYGSRAANGAILITTKRGKAGETKIDLNMQTGWGKVTRKIDLLNTEEYIALRFEALKNANMTPGFFDYDINGTWDQTKSTDWQKELIGGTAQYQNFRTSISGGNESTQFLAGAGYVRETTVFPGDFSDAKISLNMNLHHKSKSDKFKFNISANYLQGTNRLPQTDLTTQAMLLPSNAPAIYNSDGSINWGQSKTVPNLYTFDNPIASTFSRYTQKTNNLISSGQLSYEIIPDLILKADMGYNRLEGDEVSTTPWTSVSPGLRSFIPRSAKYAINTTESWIAEPQLSYSKEFSFGNLEALLGGTFQQTNSFMNSFLAQDFVNDAQLENMLAAPSFRVTGFLKSTYKYNAFFGRINYRLNDKYIVNLTARRDGSSRFGSENLFHNFYAVGGAWVFSSENFLQKINFLSFGKLRASYGTTGNDQIGDYQFLDLYNNLSVDIPYQNVVGLTSNGLSNPYLQWEETRKLNLGLDVSFFKNKINLTANYFRNRSSNQLLGYRLSAVSGFNSIVRNLPAVVQNTGWEFLLDVNPIRTAKFNWQSSLNLTIPRNKLIRYDDLDNNGSYIIGQSLNVARAYNYAGVNRQTGLYEFVNSKGELTSSPDPASDKTALIDLNPKWYGGLSNTITFQSWSLDFLLQYVKKKSPNFRYPAFPGLDPNLNQTSNVLNHWKSPGDVAEIQKITANFDDIYETAEAVNSSTAAFSDASYLRLKNLSLTYNLPDTWLQKAHISHARIYAQGQNLLTFTKFFEADPESISKLALPPLRVYTIGLQITF